MIKPIVQSINLRTGHPPVIHATAAGARAYQTQVARARAEGHRKGHQYVVAPRCTVTLPSGQILQAGEPVTKADLETSKQRGWRRLRELVFEGRVLECFATPHEPEPPPEAA